MAALDRLPTPPPYTHPIGANTVIAKFIDDHPLSVAKIQQIVTHTWPMRDKIEVSRMEDVFLFRCLNEEDRDDLIQLENVSIMGALLVLKPCNPNISPADWHFRDTVLWVQIHGVPKAHVKSEVAMGLAGILGQATDVDLKGRRAMIRAKVRIDLKLPIQFGAYFDTGEEGGFVWIVFRYENILKFCKNCRRIDHLSKHCSAQVESCWDKINAKSPNFCVENLKGA